MVMFKFANYFQRVSAAVSPMLAKLNSWVQKNPTATATRNWETICSMLVSPPWQVAIFVRSDTETPEQKISKLRSLNSIQQHMSPELLFARDHSGWLWFYCEKVQNCRPESGQL